AELRPEAQGGLRVHVHEAGSFAPLLQVEAGEVLTVVNDHLGMPKELVDARGRVAWAAAHSAWGRVTEVQRDAGAAEVSSPFRLLGQYADEETGLCYVRFRYFDAEAGRWCSPDPLGIRADTNLAGFGGAPTLVVDVFGLCAIQTPVKPGVRNQPDPARSLDTREIQNPRATTAQGFPRDNIKFWKAWNEKFPGQLSEANVMLINGVNPKTGKKQRPTSPKVDDHWLDSHPHHADHVNEKLVHHHSTWIDPETGEFQPGPHAFPVPASTHQGYEKQWHG
ncbi:MAG TPA: hypothetical protein ENK10_06290, partial [Acidobacteria bacterium]|nr:hypothetical protein [Acidobacteriota bacterium]